MSYYRKCPRCGSNLDPGETCTCASEDRENNQTEEKNDDGNDN